MKKGRQPDKRIDKEINSLAATMSQVISKIESKQYEMDSELSILKNHHSNLDNRVSYLEKKVLKK